MKRALFIVFILVLSLGFLKHCLAGKVDEDKMIMDLYNKGAMAGYATAPETKPFWQDTSSPYYSPYYWYPYAPSNNQDAGYNIEVKPAGRILIHAEPIDSEVYVDGRKLQQLPDLTYQVAVFSGQHHVDIIKDGYKGFSEDVNVYPGGGLVIPIKLQKTGNKK